MQRAAAGPVTCGIRDAGEVEKRRERGRRERKKKKKRKRMHTLHAACQPSCLSAFERMSNALFVKVDAVVVLATGVTATSGMLAVLANTAVTVADLTLDGERKRGKKEHKAVGSAARRARRTRKREAANASAAATYAHVAGLLVAGGHLRRRKKRREKKEETTAA